jgi:UDP-N-acetylmuramoyl-tripeptide--D-alanyl-D-alanine ligase
MDKRTHITQISFGQLAKVVSGELYGASSDSCHVRMDNISIDSRSLKPGALYIAILGEQYDGHDFVIDALDKGAVGAFVSTQWYSRHAEVARHGIVISVQDVIIAMQSLARWHRLQFELPIIAITGSNGKTSTKDMTASILDSRYQVLKTPGNLNSQVGTPQVLYSLNTTHDMAVFELGMNHPGEMARLAKMTQPTVGVITNVGPAHLAYLKSLEGVGRAKGELLENLPPDGWAILNGDDPHVMAQRKRTDAKVITFGRSMGADVKIKSLTPSLEGSTFELEDGLVCDLVMPGEHQVLNALVAIAVSRLFNIPDETIQSVLGNLQSSAMRLQSVKIGHVHILDDTYNANPSSTESALKTLASTGKRKIAILGDMLELGDLSTTAHRAIGQSAGQSADIVLSVGEHAQEIAEGAIETGIDKANLFSCKDTHEATEIIISMIKEGDVILIKGSRGMKMETIVEAISRSIRSK